MTQPQPAPIPPVPPAPPVPPDPAVPGTPGVAVPGPGGTQAILTTPPRTRAELEALRARRSELSRQLSSASDRRDDVAEELLTASGPARAGLEQRLQVLDSRIAQLETDIATSGQQLASAPASLLASTQASGRGTSPLRINQSDVEMTPILVLFVLFVLAPIALAIARGIWKRGDQAARHSGLSGEDSQRLARLEQAVEAIAIEVERVSEGQRFVTNLLAERTSAQALAAAQRGETVQVAR